MIEAAARSHMEVAVQAQADWPSWHCPKWTVKRAASALRQRRPWLSTGRPLAYAVTKVTLPATPWELVFLGVTGVAVGFCADEPLSVRRRVSRVEAMI